MRSWILLAVLAATIIGCRISPPLEDYSIARVAIASAKEAEAPRLAPGYWHRSEEAFRLGEEAFREEDYDLAQKRFKKAQAYAERAEDSAKLAAKQGEGDF